MIRCDIARGVEACAKYQAERDALEAEWVKFMDGAQWTPEQVEAMRKKPDAE